VPKSARPRPEPKRGGRPINIDADIENADWLRSLSWDLPTEPDTFLAIIKRAGMTDTESVRVVTFRIQHTAPVALCASHPPKRAERPVRSRRRGTGPDARLHGSGGTAAARKARTRPT